MILVHFWVTRLLRQLSLLFLSFLPALAFAQQSTSSIPSSNDWNGIVSLVDKVESDARRALTGAAKCANSRVCPVLNCGKSTKLIGVLSNQLVILAAFDYALSRHHKAYLNYQVQLLKSSVQTGKNAANVQVALMWQRPLLEFGGAMFDIASVLGGLQGLSANPSLDGIHELFGDLDSAYQGISKMFETDIKKAYPSGDTQHQQIIRGINKEFDLDGQNITIRRQEASRIRKVLDRLHLVGFADIVDFTTYKSDFANLRDLFPNDEERAAYDAFVKTFNPSSNPSSLPKANRSALKQARAEKTSALRSAVLSIAARHLKNYAFKDMKARIKRMQAVNLTLVAEDRTIAEANSERVRILGLQQRTESAVKTVRAALKALELCRSGRFCDGSPEIRPPGNAPERFSKAVPFYVGKLKDTSGQVATLTGQAFTFSKACSLDTTTITDLPSPGACPNTPLIPGAPKLVTKSLPSLVSCAQCEAAQPRLNEADQALQAATRSRDAVQNELAPLLSRRAGLQQQFDALGAEVAAKAGQGISSIDVTTGIRVETRAQPDGRVVLVRTYPDGRTETSHYRQSTTRRLQQQQAALQEQLDAVEQQIRPVRQRYSARDQVVAEARDHIASVQARLTDCQSQCQQTHTVKELGNGVYALPDSISNTLGSPLLRTQSTDLAPACSQCAKLTSEWSTGIGKANNLRREIRGQVADFKRWMELATAILRQPTQNYTFAPADLIDRSPKGRTRLCEALGPKRATNIFQSHRKGRLSFGGATTILISAPTKDSPGALRRVRKLQSDALALLPKISQSIRALQDVSVSNEKRRAAIKTCERDRCALSDIGDLLAPTPRWVAAQCSVCNQDSIKHRRVRQRTVNSARRVIRFENELRQLREAAEAAGSNAEAGGLLQPLNEMRDFRLPRERNRFRNRTIEEWQARAVINTCNERCPPTPTTNGAADELLDVQIERVIPMSGNNPFDTVDPVAQIATGLTGRTAQAGGSSSGTGGSSSGTGGSSSGTGVNFLQNCIGSTITQNRTIFAGVVFFASQAANNCEVFINTGGGESMLPLVLIVSSEGGLRGRHGLTINGTNTLTQVTPAAPATLTSPFGTFNQTFTVVVNTADNPAARLQFTLDITVVDGTPAFDDLIVTVINAEVL
jgi:hypothetical protein